MAQSKPAAETQPSEPTWVPVKSYRNDGYSSYQLKEYFGDAANIKLLGDMAKDPDALAREQAVRDLGQTHNVAAAPLIQAAMKDADPNVRAAAAGAAYELSLGGYERTILDALADADGRVVMTALRMVRNLKLSTAAKDIAPLLAGGNAPIQADALATLTDVGQPAATDALTALFRSPSPAVRLRAAENAALVDKAKAADVTGALAELAAKDAPAVRGAALAALGTLAFDSSRAAIDASAKDADPQVRRGALAALQNAGKRDRIKPFLDDPSAMVRLAAIRAAGQLRCEDCTGRLFELMQAVEDDLAHFAARQSLRQIGTPQVNAQAGAVVQEANKSLAPLQKALDDVGKIASDLNAKLAPYERTLSDLKASRAAQQRIDVAQAELDKAMVPFDAQQVLVDAARAKFNRAMRNLRSACWLLGELKGAEEFDTRMAIVSGSVAAKDTDVIKIDSDVLIETVFSLGRLGRPEAAGPINAVLAKSAAMAPGFFSDHPPPGSRYNGRVVISCVEALAALHNSDGLDSMRAIKEVRIKMAGRLNEESEAIMRSLPMLTTPANRATIEKEFIDKAIDDPTFLLPVRFEAIKSAGKLKLEGQTTVRLIKKVLLEERPDRNMMRVSAWAIKRITNETLPISDPVVYQGDWIIRKRE
ncbi:MAG: HEAT repeat domain-containing protein [Phycisphaerae bacterium]